MGKPVTGPLPVQVSTWLPERSGFGVDDEFDTSPSDGEWLYCLKGTQPGDRQVVWSGVHGRGIVAVVDFSGEVRPRSSSVGATGRQLYEGWGRITRLREPISVETAQAHQVLHTCFGRSIQGVKSINSDVGSAIAERVGEWPPAATFDSYPADWNERGGDWSRHRLPPEAIVLDKDRVARRLGFPSRVNPAGKKQRLLNGRYPDLWCEDGVVGEVKNQVTAAWGPAQIEDYIDQCDLQWPEHQWRGLLVQGEPAMAPNAIPRLTSSRHAHRVEVWTVRKKRLGYQVARILP